MRELHLFAGAGGGILGGILLGHTTVCAVEIEPYCRRILLQRQRDGILPKFPIWDDVRTFDGKPWRGLVDVVCGGFPCQDISAAGKGAGITGERSGLWKEMARIIGEVKPRFIFIENSPLLRTRGLATVLKDVAELGYDARWCIVSARQCGARHNRKRMWILCSNDRKVRSEWNFKKEVYRFDTFPWGEDVRGIEGLRARSGVYSPMLCGKRNGVANYVDRIHAIGNGQVPRVAKLAWELLEGI